MTKAQLEILHQLVASNSFTIGNTKRPAAIIGGSRDKVAALQLAQAGLVAIVKNNEGYQVHYAILPRDTDNFIANDFTLVTAAFVEQAAA